MDLGLRGKISMVTGASSGIGAATARLLAQEGADVVVGRMLMERQRPPKAYRLPGGRPGCAPLTWAKHKAYSRLWNR
jgi:NAD(P)-dependent dehydrogenase (short-subunit alcohol dehydrogenase family)